MHDSNLPVIVHYDLLHFFVDSVKTGATLAAHTQLLTILEIPGTPGVGSVDCGRFRWRATAVFPRAVCCCRLSCRHVL